MSVILHSISELATPCPHSNINNKNVSQFCSTCTVDTANLFSCIVQEIPIPLLPVYDWLDTGEI